MVSRSVLCLSSRSEGGHRSRCSRGQGSRVAPVRTAQEHGNTGAHTTTDVILQLTSNSSPNTLRRKLCRTGCVRCAQAGQSLLTGLPPPTPGRPSPLITAPNIIQTWMSRRVQTHPLSIQRRCPFLDKPTSLRSKRWMTSRDGNVAASTAVYRPCCIVRDPDCRWHSATTCVC